MEALDVENLSSQPSKRLSFNVVNLSFRNYSYRTFSRTRYSSAILVCTIVVAACMAVIGVQGMGSNSAMELESASAVSDSPVVAAATSKLPSWLQTDPVKLVPLNKLIKEREMIHQMAEGKISAKIYKEEHMKEGPSPRDLAMHTVHAMAQKKQLTRQELVQKPHHDSAIRPPRSASEKASEQNFDAQQAAAIKHALRVAQEKAHGKRFLKEHNHHVLHHDEDHVKEISHVRVGKTAHFVSEPQLKKELLEEEDELELVQQGEARQVAAIKKQELHKLAMLKRKDHIEELKLKLGIEELRKKMASEKTQQNPQKSEAISEKAKIKAEMARIEEEEHEKLAALKAKLDHVQAKVHVGASHSTADAKREDDTEQKDDEDKAVPSELSSSGAQSSAANSAVKPARESKLAACTTQDCDLDKEDSKWLAHRQ